MSVICTGAPSRRVSWDLRPGVTVRELWSSSVLSKERARWMRGRDLMSAEALSCKRGQGEGRGGRATVHTPMLELYLCHAGLQVLLPHKAGFGGERGAKVVVNLVEEADRHGHHSRVLGLQGHCPQHLQALCVWT